MDFLKSFISFVKDKIPVFVLTDGRPWYKQVISGILLFIMIAVQIFFTVILAAMAFIVCYAIYQQMGTSGLADTLMPFAYVLGGVAALMLTIFILVGLWLWSTDQFDDNRDDYE